MTADNVAPANNLDNPKTEKKAALPAIRSADNPTNFGNDLDFSNMSFFLFIDNKYLKPILCL